MAPGTSTDFLAQLRAHRPRRKALMFPKGKIALPATVHVAGIGRATGRESYDHDGLRRGPRTFVLLKYTLAGEGRLRFEDRHYTLETGKAMLITVPHEHRYWLPRGGDWKFFWLSFHGHEAIHICRYLIGRAGPVLNLREDTLAAAAKLVLDAMGRRIGSPAAASTRAYEVIMRLYDELEVGQPRSAPERTRDIELAIGYGRQNPSGAVSVADLAKAAGYSRFHFGRRFRESEGIPPSEFLRNERMAKAARLLAETDLSITDIAARLGYPDPSYFTKVFRRVYGMPPKSFRQTI